MLIRACSLNRSNTVDVDMGILAFNFASYILFFTSLSAGGCTNNRNKPV